jgi:hypothetical protein
MLTEAEIDSNIAGSTREHKDQLLSCVDRATHDVFNFILNQQTAQLQTKENSLHAQNHAGFSQLQWHVLWTLILKDHDLNDASCCDMCAVYPFMLATMQAAVVTLITPSLENWNACVIRKYPCNV